MKHFNLQIKIQEVEQVSKGPAPRGTIGHQLSNGDERTERKTVDLLDFKTTLPTLEQIKAMGRAALDMIPDRPKTDDK